MSNQLLTTSEVVDMLAKRKIAMTTSQVSELAKNQVFPNAQKDAGRNIWHIPTEDVERFIRFKKRRVFGLRLASVLSIITILGLTSVANDFWQIIDRASVPAPRNEVDTLLFEGCMLINNGEYLEAEERFSRARVEAPRSPAPWHWLARLAYSRANPEVAVRYLDEALELAPADVQNIALKIKLLIVGVDYTGAGELVRASNEISVELDQWLYCLNTNGVINPRLMLTSSELETICPFVLSDCSAIGS